MHEWQIDERVGDAGEFHVADPEPIRSATFWDVSRPTLVLGSSQDRSCVDEVVVPLLGVEVVQRRSGGGAVLLLPGEFVWLDLVLPVDDPLSSADVGRSMLWVGELWQRALANCGLDTEVHRGPLVHTRWSRAVCWAGVGTGEVVHAGAKVVGISQRRTRTWSRFQSMCHLRWRPDQVAALVAPPRPSVRDLARVAVCPPVGSSPLRAQLVESLARVGRAGRLA